MSVRDYKGIRYESGIPESTCDTLTVEEALQINVNGSAFTVSMRTPGHDEQLTRGILHAEGIINDRRYISPISVSEKNDQGIISVVNVDVPHDKLGDGYSNSRSLLSVSSCGICGKTELSDLDFEKNRIADPQRVDVELLRNLFAKMETTQHGFSASGGCHAASVFTIQGELLCTMEDIGRHNAVDKVVGELILSDRLDQAKIMTVSGRLSYEIVVKCFKAQIPFLAAVSAPSSLAVDYAKELGITLFGFCRKNRMTCYAHPERVVGALATLQKH